MTEVKESQTSSSHLETMPHGEDGSLGPEDPKGSDNDNGNPNHPQVSPEESMDISISIAVLKLKTQQLELADQCKAVYLSHHLLFYLLGQYQLEQFHRRHTAHNQGVPSDRHTGRRIGLF